ncbi:MAG: FHA domain-containing protein [Planctomycetota bacterium]
MSDFDPTASQALEAGQGWLSIHHADGTHEHLRLALALTTVGRSEQNVIELVDPKLSRFHCELERAQDGYRVRDCNSRNGTQVNGEPVQGERLLADGDRIKIGRTHLVFSASRPDELRSDRLQPLPASEETVAAEEDDELRGDDTPSMAQRRPTRGSYDTRRTRSMEALDVRHRNPWKLLADASSSVLRATHRRELLELTLGHAQTFFEAHGAMIALGPGPDQLSVTAAANLAGEAKDRCLNAASRCVVRGAPIVDDRWTLAVPLTSREEKVGALVLHDLSSVPPEQSHELEALVGFAQLVAHTLTTSLLVEEVRREERAAGARRIAQDLRAVLRPPSLDPLPGLEVARVTTRGESVERSFWDRVAAPARAGREEVYFALGDVPDPESAPPRRLRRRGESAFVSLLGQAELRGALRALVEVMPRTSDLLAQLDGALRREASVEQVSLILTRYDQRAGGLRFAGAGHAPVLVRRADGAVESFAPVGPALGSEGGSRTSERDLLLARDDQALLMTLGALRLERRSAEPLDRLFARLGGPALPVEVVAQRIAEALVEDSAVPDPEGFTLLLLRKSQ